MHYLLGIFNYILIIIVIILVIYLYWLTNISCNSCKKINNKKYNILTNIGESKI
jgi:hypothetical protein